MGVRRRSNVLLAVLALHISAALTTRALAAVDVSGRWGVVMQSFFVGPQQAEWDFEQSGTAITLTITFNGPGLFGTSGPYDGTIDPDTGVFHVDVPDAAVFPGFPPCPDSRIDGTATADSIGGTYRSYFFKVTPPLVGCNDGGGPFSGVRCGPGVDACCPGPSCCGNGVVVEGEECDDGNQVSGDCCSSTCTAEPAGAPCSDTDVCTDDLGCDGAGSCAHANNTAPCGTTCLPGVCTNGLCDYDPLPEGAPCNDGNACTSGDHCNGTGNCLGTGTLTCGPCEACHPLTGCVAEPQPALSCDTSAGSVLTLSVANPAKARVSWRRKDPSGAPELAGNPTTTDPLTTATYDVCIFGATGSLFRATVNPGGTCNGQPCWQSTADGYRYRDPGGTSGGVKRMNLGGRDPSFDLKVNAKGANLLPGSLANAAAPVVAELRARVLFGSACWQSRFDESMIGRSSTRLRARNRAQ